MSNAVVKGLAVTEFSALLQPVPPKEVLDKLARTDIEIEAIKAEAYKAGFEEGKIDGRKAGIEEGKTLGFQQAFDEAAAKKQAELDALHAEFERTVDKVESAIQDWFLKSEPSLAQLSILIAKRILAQELATNPDAILAMTREAITEVTHATSARIRLNPFDSEILEAHRAEIMSAASSVRQLEIVEDDSIAGGCVIETDGGVVDARVEMKLEEIAESLRRAA